MNRGATGIIVLAAVLGAILYLWQPWNPGESPLKLGLDLQGGLRVTLQSDQPNPLREDLAAARDIIENRVNQFGVAESLVQTSGSEDIVVELPGLTAEDQERALDLIGQQAVLEFRLVRSASNNLPTEALTASDLEDVAFTGEDLRLIPAALHHARRSRRIITQNIVLSLAIIAVLLPLAITGVLGLAAVVLVHEGAEVLVILNGLRASRVS